MTLVQRLNNVEEAAAKVTRNIPEAHEISRAVRRHLFRRAVRKMLNLLYALDPATLDLEQFDFVEKQIDKAIKSVEIHMLWSDGPADPFLCDSLERLRLAKYGISRGYSADPRKQPSNDEVEAAGRARLSELFASGELTPSR